MVLSQVNTILASVTLLGYDQIPESLGMSAVKLQVQLIEVLGSKKTVNHRV